MDARQLHVDGPRDLECAWSAALVLLLPIGRVTVNRNHKAVKGMRRRIRKDDEEKVLKLCPGQARQGMARPGNEGPERGARRAGRRGEMRRDLGRDSGRGIGVLSE